MQYDFALTPLGGQIINAKGRFLKYRTGTGLIRIKLTDGAVIDLLPGQGVSNRQFESIEIVDKSNAANTGTILAGDFDFRDERISGTVDVVDGGKARTQSNTAFASVLSVPGNAGFPGITELFNPVGASKILVCEKLVLSTPSAGTIMMGIADTAVSASFGAPASKLSGGAASVANICVSNTVAMPGTWKTLVQFNIEANKPTPHEFREPIVLLPGYGIFVVQTALGVGVTASHEFYEQPLT